MNSPYNDEHEEAAFEEVRLSKEEMALRFKRFCCLCHQIFECSVEGKELYSMLREHFEDAVCPPDKEPSYGYFREGQNNLIRQFKKGILFHKEEMKKTNE